MRRSPRVPLHCLALILAASGCGRDPVGELLVQLQSPAVEMRRSAARELAKIDALDERAVAALADAVADDDPDVRRLSAIALGHAGSAAIRKVHKLHPLLKDSREHIQRAAALAIMRIDPHNPGYIPVLTAELADADGRLMLEVGRLGAAGAWAVPALVKLVSHESDKVRALAAQTLGNLGRVAAPARPALELVANRDKSPAVAAAAKTALQKIRKLPAPPAPVPPR